MVARGTPQPQEARDGGKKAGGVAVGVAAGCATDVIGVVCPLLLPDGRVQRPVGACLDALRPMSI